jgi:WD40 repeat protein
MEGHDKRRTRIALLSSMERGGAVTDSETSSQPRIGRRRWVAVLLLTGAFVPFACGILELRRAGWGGLHMLAKRVPANTHGDRRSTAFAISPTGDRVFLEIEGEKLAVLATEGFAESKALDLLAGDSNRTLAAMCVSWGASVFSPDGRFVVVSERGMMAQGFLRWSLETGEKSYFERFHREVRPDLLALAADEKSIVAAVQFGDVPQVWDIETGALGRRFERVVPDFGKGDPFSVHDLAVEPTGGRLFVAYGHDVVLFDFASGKRTGTWTVGAEDIATLAFLPGGASLLVGTVSGALRVLDGATGAERSGLELHSPIESVEISHEPGDDLALVVTGDGAIRVLDLGALRILARLEPTAGAHPLVRFRPGSHEFFVYRGPGSVERWGFDWRPWSLPAKSLR